MSKLMYTFQKQVETLLQDWPEHVFHSFQIFVIVDTKEQSIL